MTRGRKACTGGDRCRPNSLDEALYCAVNHTPGMDSKAIASAMGIRHGYLAQAVNPDDDAHHLQAKLLLPLVHVTGNTAPVEWLARASGGVFVPLPPTTTGECPRAAGLAIVQQLGEVARVTEQALADNSINPDEAEEIHRNLSRLMDAVARSSAVITRVTEPTGGVR